MSLDKTRNKTPLPLKVFLPICENSQPRKFNPQSTKIMCSPLNKVWSYIKTCAAGTAGTWAKLRQCCRTELINLSRNPSTVINNLPKFFQNKIAIFLKTKTAPTTTMTSNFLSLPRQEIHFIFQHWKPLILNQFLYRQKDFVYSFKFPTSWRFSVQR